MKEAGKMAIITLTQLTEDDREQFILDNQRAFKYGATEEFGMRDNHLKRTEKSFPGKPSRTVSTMESLIVSARMAGLSGVLS